MPFCSNCGTKLNEGAKFCSECGSSANILQATDTTHRQLEIVKKKMPKQEKSLFGEISGALASTTKSIADNAKKVVSTLASQETTDEYNSSKQQYADDKVPLVYNTVFPISIPVSNSSKRQQEYAGIILKCPNCGATITQTTAICPDCGYHITGQIAVSSIRVYNEQLMAIEGTRKKPGLGSVFGVIADPVDHKKLSLIRSFPIPYSLDDIFEFMVLAAANIDVGLSKNTMMNRYQGGAKSGESSLTIPKTISDAWVSKMQQAYQKAEISFPNDPLFANIKRIYFDKMKELKIKVN